MNNLFTASAFNSYGFLSIIILSNLWGKSFHSSITERTVQCVRKPWLTSVGPTSMLRHKEQAACIKHSVPETRTMVIGGFNPFSCPIKQMALLPSLYNLETIRLTRLTNSKIGNGVDLTQNRAHHPALPCPSSCLSS